MILLSFGLCVCLTANRKLENRRENLYYVDKTGLIKGLLKNRSYVNLFTRPRRFGKTLNMSMLKCFFECGSDRVLFDGLEIAEEKELCDKYMGKFPVISISLKAMTGDTFNEAKGMLCDIIGREAACRAGGAVNRNSVNKRQGLMVRKGVA